MWAVGLHLKAMATRLALSFLVACALLMGWLASAVVSFLGSRVVLMPRGLSREPLLVHTKLTECRTTLADLELALGLMMERLLQLVPADVVPRTFGLEWAKRKQRQLSGEDLIEELERRP